jgi:hypothetical protein
MDEDPANRDIHDVFIRDAFRKGIIDDERIEKVLDVII